MSKRYKIFSSMFMCEDYNVETSTASNIFTKINTKDNLNASFFMIMQIRCINELKDGKIRFFLFLENDKIYKLMHVFEIPNENHEFKNERGINYTNILEFEDYAFPEKGKYVWSLYAISVEDLKREGLTTDTEELFEYFQKKDEYLINFNVCNVL